jgi:hypothetical protein
MKMLGPVGKAGVFNQHAIAVEDDCRYADILWRQSHVSWVF